VEAQDWDLPEVERVVGPERAFVIYVDAEPFRERNPS
jgi:hypothetical protein